MSAVAYCSLSRDHKIQSPFPDRQMQLVVAYIGISSSSRIDWSVKETTVARIKRLIEKIRHFRWPRKHKEGLVYSRDKLPRSDAVRKGIQSQWRQVGGPMSQALPKETLKTETEVWRFRIDWVSKKCVPVLIRSGCLIYVYTKQVPSGRSVASWNGVHPARCNVCNKL